MFPTFIFSKQPLHASYDLTIKAVLDQALLDLIRGKARALTNPKVGQTLGRGLCMGVLHPVRSEGTSGVAEASLNGSIRASFWSYLLLLVFSALQNLTPYLDPLLTEVMDWQKERINFHLCAVIYCCQPLHWPKLSIATPQKASLLHMALQGRVIVKGLDVLTWESRG